MSEIERFVSWVKEKGNQNKMLCHFYYSPKGQTEKDDGGKQKKYYTKVDYAHFNLFSKSKYWIVKGTTGHGVDSASTVPVLNCYEINKKFTKALKRPINEWKANYELGIVLDKEGLINEYGETNVRDVKQWRYGDPDCASRPAWCCDKVKYRRGVLDPFNMCDVVRLRIIRSKKLRQPIKSIHPDLIAAVLVKHGNYHVIRKLLQQKKWKKFEVFPLLPEYP